MMTNDAECNEDEFSDHKAILIIQDRINAAKQTATPVTAVLQVHYQVDDQPEDCDLVPDLSCLYNISLNKPRTLLADNARFEVTVSFEQTHPGSRYYTTRSGYADQILDAVLHRVKRDFLNDCERNYPYHEISMEYLLSKPVFFCHIPDEQSHY